MAQDSFAVGASKSSGFAVYPSPDSDAAGGYVLLHRQRPAWIVVNHTGLQLASMLAAGHSTDEASKRLASQYGLTADTARQEILPLALQLAAFLTSPPLSGVRTPAIRELFVHLTTRCNLNCPHCYFLLQATSCHKDLPAALVMRTLAELSANGGNGVTLSGGEPLLHPQFREIVACAAQRLPLTVLSNGTCIDRDMAKFLAANKVNIQLSVDGSGPEVHDAVRGQGSFHKVEEALGYLQEAGLGAKTWLCTTLMSHNYRDLANIIALAERLHVPKLRILPLRPVGNARERWHDLCLSPEIYRDLFAMMAGMPFSPTSLQIECGLSGFFLKPGDICADSIWCPVGKQVTIDTDGAVYPCVLLMDKRLAIGNIFDHSIAQLSSSPQLANICRHLGERRHKLTACAGCLWKNLCQGGCMGQAWERYGTLLARDDFCAVRQEAYGRAFTKILAKTFVKEPSNLKHEFFA
jgi:radical SAM protein with 4Fe4S-binding SPASM domain